MEMNEYQQHSNSNTFKAHSKKHELNTHTHTSEKRISIDTDFFLESIHCGTLAWSEFKNGTYLMESQSSVVCEFIMKKKTR